MSEMTALEALSRQYKSIYTFDLEQNRVTTIKSSPDVEQFVSIDRDVKKTMLNFVEQLATPQFREDCLRFMDPDTLPERLSESDKVTLFFEDIHTGWCRASFVSMNDCNPATKVMFTVEDINEEVREEIDRQKEIERQREELAEANAVIHGLSMEYYTIWAVDKLTTQMHLLRSDAPQNYIQDSVQVVLNYKYWDEPAVDYISRFVEPEDQAFMMKHVLAAEVMKQLETSDRYELNFRQRNEKGEVTHQQMVFVNADTEDGKKRFVCGLRNIDELVKAEQKHRRELEEARAAAEAASKAKTTFLFNMSHDIRTPLNAIKGFTELASMDPGNREKTEEYQRKVLTATEQLTGILNNVLEMARIENDKITIEEELTNAGDFFYSLISMFEGDMQRKNLTFTSEYIVNHEYYYLDTTHLTEIVMNIVSNAVKYTPDGGEISIRTIELPGSEKDTCIIQTTVSDTGIGMSEEFLENIFEEFSRERTSSQNGIEGTGLGMAIVKRLVELMHGTITINSQIGKGSEVIIAIPHRYASAPAERKEADKINESFDLSGARVLLAEDIDVNALLAMEILTMNGFKVERASDGVECIDMLQNAENGYYDLILMDIQMPVLNGYKTTYQIRSMEDEEKANIPIVALSANAFREDIEKSRMAGMNAHIAKPIDIEELMRTLHEVLGKHRRLRIEDLLSENGLSLDEMENSETGIYCVDDTRRIVYWNKASETITGYSAAQVVGKHCFYSGLKHQDKQGIQLCSSKCPMMATILDTEPRENRVTVLCSDGQRRWVHVRTSPLFDENTVRGAVEYFTLDEQPNEGIGINI